ncbi:MAG: class I SAM-dependent methyltransferase [Chlorobi bacterium]|nr:class I SAM-dependent methyltransferase [Chlorobiota bacterium]
MMGSESVGSPLEMACSDFFKGDIDAIIAIHSNKADKEEVPVSYFFRSYEDMPELEKLALSMCSGEVLDIGAGLGVHSLWLREHGIDVSSLEIQEGLVALMRKRGLDKVYAADVFEFYGQKFDTLLLLMNGIGIASDIAGLERFLAHARSLLKKGGKILLDSSDLLYLYQEDDGSVLLDLSEEYYGEVEYEFEYNGIRSKPFKWLFIDFGNLWYYARKAGFEAELISEGGHFDYLARLSLIS